MDAYLWVAMSGANAALSRQAVTANNLANANTTGYRAAEAAASNSAMSSSMRKY